MSAREKRFTICFFNLPLNASTVSLTLNPGEVKTSYNRLNWEAWQESAPFSNLREIQWSIVRRRIEEYQSIGQIVFRYLNTFELSRIKQLWPTANSSNEYSFMSVHLVVRLFVQCRYEKGVSFFLFFIVVCERATF